MSNTWKGSEYTVALLVCIRLVLKPFESFNPTSMLNQTNQWSHFCFAFICYVKNKLSEVTLSELQSLARVPDLLA